ncbi:ATP-binding protein [Stenotrophomonas forensis]|uniref:ATPase domain-containing protein n=1 Tax=Stenotrophomonas forensis TaxID=2871169 RepID=A0ABY7XYD2_9GAMM|nr:ATP-binding protein [Stenotrophomonas sp. DFS-20110405]WDM62740.1 hypothetical protein K5L94_16760 [Stenotrophomonas sp. DFS-20110405]
MSEFKRGTVDSYDDKGGYGIIIPDPVIGDGADAAKHIVHRRSLEKPSLLLSKGDRVVFKTEIVPRGALAADVHLEAPPTPSNAQEAFGSIHKFDNSTSQGVLRTAQQKSYTFHTSEITNSDHPPQIGDRVSFLPTRNSIGAQASQVRIEIESIEEVGALRGGSDAAPKNGSNILAQAILARDARRFSEAERLYELGMKKHGSVQLVTSYAAMQKNRNRRAEAMRIYEEGMKLFPNNIKLRDDAGNLAISMNNLKQAIIYFKGGLDLAKSTPASPTGGLLLSLARAYYKGGSRSDLRNCIATYEAAEREHSQTSSRRQSLPRNDILMKENARVRVQHHRGSVTFDFIQSSGFKIERARLFDQATAGADFIVEINRPELLESYGISGSILVRCFFKSDINRSDLESIDNYAKSEGESGLIDEQVVIAVVSSLPETLQSTLYRRLEDRSRSVPAIVPITQEELETSSDPMDTLRKTLDQWLYRRDLFSLNTPVSGRRFFGREKAITELREAISSGTAAGVFGLRKVGKTSILKEVERRGTEAGDIVIYVDLLRVPADIKNARWIYWKLGVELHTAATRAGLKDIRWRIGPQYRDFLDVPSDFPIATAFDSDLTQALRATAHNENAPTPKIVIMLDEVERLLPNTLGKEGFEGFFDLLSYLRGVSQESEDFVPIVTAANAAIAEVSQFNERDNPVFNFFREIYLPLLQLKEMKTMVRTLGRGMGITIDDDACNHIHRLTGGHPFFTRQLCSYISEQNSERPLQVTSDIVNSLSEGYLEFSGKDFQEITERFSRDYPDELEACVKIAHSPTPISISEITTKGGNSSINIRHLIGYQIIEVKEGRAAMSIELMRLWLEKESSPPSKNAN